MPLKNVIQETRQQMDRSVEHFDRELRGIRTGRATTALIEYVKVDYYGSPTELRELAAIGVVDPTQLLVKPFDPSARAGIVKAIETADLGLNPMTDGEVIRIAVPAPSGERRQQLTGQVRKMAEDAKVSIRNERRDANKHIDQVVKDKAQPVSEDQGHDARAEVDELTKKHIELIDERCDEKVAEIEEI